MIDARFYRVSPARVGDILKALGLTGAREAEDEALLSAAPIAAAGPGDVSFTESEELPVGVRAALVFAPGAGRPNDPPFVVRHPSPRYAFSQAVNLFIRPRDMDLDLDAHGGGARERRLAPGVVVDPTADIGEGSTIGPNSVIGPGVRIGRRCRIGAGVVIGFALIGDDVAILSGTVIGETGFGLSAGPRGPELSVHLGRVIIQDRASIGALCTIDRGMFADTVVGEASQIDNHCHLAHNVRLGAGVIMAAFGGISGSVEIGDRAMLGGRVGVADHVRIGAGARLSAGAAVMRDVPDGETHGGFPAKPIKNWMRETAWLAREAQMRKGRSG